MCEIIPFPKEYKWKAAAEYFAGRIVHHLSIRLEDEGYNPQQWMIEEDVQRVIDVMWDGDPAIFEVSDIRQLDGQAEMFVDHQWQNYVH